MAAKTKSELLALTDKEYRKLNAVLDEISPKSALKKREEDTSLKDVVGHRAHWIKLFLEWYKDGLADKKVYFPAKGYKWNQLKEYNKSLRLKQKDLSWADARKLLRSNHKKLVKFIEDHSDEELYGAPMKGANNKWTPGRWARPRGRATTGRRVSTPARSSKTPE